MLRRIAPGDGWLAGRRPFVHLLAEATAAEGATLALEPQFGHVGRVHLAAGRVLPVFGNALGVNGDAAAALAADKDYTARMLIAAGLPAPPGLLVFGPAYARSMGLKNTSVAQALPGPQAALAWAEAQGWPVIAKPNQGSEGRGIHRAADPAALQADLDRLFTTDQKVRVEAHCPGADYRLLVWDGAVRLAYRRDPVRVTGDGVAPVAALIAALQARLTAGARGPKLSAKDPVLLRSLDEQGLSLDAVPPAGQAVSLMPQANLSTGGLCTDLTDALPQAAKALAVAAAATVGLRLAGVDILAPDLTKAGPAADGVSGGDLAGATVLEVNSAPGLDGYAASSAQAWSRARATLQEILRTA